MEAKNPWMFISCLLINNCPYEGQFIEIVARIEHDIHAYLNSKANLQPLVNSLLPLCLVN